MHPTNMKPFRAWCRENGLSPQSGYREVNAGRLIVVKVGRRSFVRNSDAAAWLKSLKRYEPAPKPD